MKQIKITKINVDGLERTKDEFIKKKLEKLYNAENIIKVRIRL